MRRTRVAISAAGIALALFTGACAQTAAAHAAGTTAATHLTSNSPSAVKAAATPPVVGVNLYDEEDYSLADTTAWGERDIKYIARNLGLHAIVIAWDYNVPSRRSDTVDATGPRTPSLADIQELTKIAKSYDLRVEYRVLFAVGGSDTRSGSISPEHLNDWLASLLTAETPALKLAEAEKVSEFVAGTEMASIDQSPLWGGFFDAAALYYHGILSYASWGGNPAEGGFFSDKRVLLPLKEYGASAYPPIDLPATATVAELTTAWEDFLRNAPANVLAHTAIDEIGIPAKAGAYHAPETFNGMTGTADDTVQSRWFDAACRAVGAEHLRGIYFWSMPIDDNPAAPYPSLVTFEGKEASIAVIKGCARYAEEG